MALLTFPDAEAWRAWRFGPCDRPRVGGSTIPDALACSPYSGPPSPGSASAGHALEPLLIARAVQGEGLPAPLDGVHVYTDDGRPHWHASPDAVLWSDGPAAVVECKAVFLGQREIDYLGAGDPWRLRYDGDPLDGLPLFVRVQVVWAMALSGLDGVVVAGLLDRYRLDVPADVAARRCALRVYHLDREAHDDECRTLVETIAALEDAGWTPAAPSPLTAPTIATDGPVLRAEGSDADLLRALLRAKHHSTDAAALYADLRDRAAAAIPPAASGLRGDGITITRTARGIRVSED